MIPQCAFTVFDIFVILCTSLYNFQLGLLIPPTTKGLRPNPLGYENPKYWQGVDLYRNYAKGLGLVPKRCIKMVPGGQNNTLIILGWSTPGDPPKVRVIAFHCISWIGFSDCSARKVRLKLMGFAMEVFSAAQWQVLPDPQVMCVVPDSEPPELMNFVG